MHTITPASGLPSITVPVFIDGYSQPGASVNTLVNGDNAVLLIEIYGSVSLSYAFLLQGTASGSLIKGLVIDNSWSWGIYVQTDTVAIEGCFIGIDPSGLVAHGNTVGVLAGFGSPTSGMRIGGTSPAVRNVISGNGTAIWIQSGANQLVQGNFVGTDRTGANALPNGTGVDVESSDNLIGGSTAAARNVIGGNSGVGISVSSTGNRIQGNYIGTDVTGANALGNGSGIFTTGAAQIGGLTATPGTPPGNVISANGSGGSGRGIFVANGISNNIIQGNLIGTDATGTQPLGNGLNGVQIFGASNVIGGTDVMARNVISANGLNGISLGTDNAAVQNNLVQGNFIGTDISGTQLLGNGGDGVFVQQASNNTIGGISTIQGQNPGNLIAGNGGRGVDIFFGTTGIAVLGNSIHSNGGLGIDLGRDSVTENDHCDGDAGPNNSQNFPVITSASFGGGMVTVSGTLDSVPSMMYRLEFFSSASGDASGYGEGRSFIGSTTVTTDGNCNANFGPLTFPIPSGQISAFSRKTHGSAGTFDVLLPLVVTATATRLDAMLNPIETSEFSAGVSQGSSNVGIECRTGPTYQMIINFATNVTVGNAAVTSGTGMVSSFSGSGTSQITVNLTGVTNVQRITVTLMNVNDGTHTGVVPVTMGVLIGDVNANATVNAADVAQTKGHLGQTVDTTNFRFDVNANGGINAADTAIVKQNSGTSLPP